MQYDVGLFFFFLLDGFRILGVIIIELFKSFDLFSYIINLNILSLLILNLYLLHYFLKSMKLSIKKIEIHSKIDRKKNKKKNLNHLPSNSIPI